MKVILNRVVNTGKEKLQPGEREVDAKLGKQIIDKGYGVDPTAAKPEVEKAADKGAE